MYAGEYYNSEFEWPSSMLSWRVYLSFMGSKGVLIPASAYIVLLTCTDFVGMFDGSLVVIIVGFSLLVRRRAPNNCRNKENQ
jgi:hypothetical protein